MKSTILLLILSIATAANLFAAGDLASGKRAYEKKDYVAALKEFTPLAEQSDADAQLMLGKMYMIGQGVKQDRDQAIKWLKASAALGNSDAQFFLGSMYVLPQKDVLEGIKWLRLSAGQGNQDAQYLLGKTYMQGATDVPREPVQGCMWLLLAAKGNKQFYQDETKAAERQITSDQVAKAEALAAEWKPKTGMRPEEHPE